MLINVDVKSLEIVVAAMLSGDPVLRQEIIAGADIHENNRLKFNLPSRLIAKLFVFRLIYGGSAYAYANDILFKDVGLKEEGWQGVIDTYYEKYRGMSRWHTEIVNEAKRNKQLEIPSGRYYPFSPEPSYNGFKWPITKIKNYPVQGFGADLVKLARLECKRLLNESGLKEVLLVCTIHDSIVVDTPSHNLDAVAKILLQCVQSVPALCKKVWDYDFDLPLTAEVQYGKNKGEMLDYLFDKA